MPRFPVFFCGENCFIHGYRAEGGGALFVAQDAKVLQFDKSVRSKVKKGRGKKFEIVMHL